VQYRAKTRNFVQIVGTLKGPPPCSHRKENS
jgi:hypothetical protein